MSAKKTIMFAAMFCLAAAAAALSPLPSGKAPFKQDSGKARIYSGDAVLDSEKLTWNYGSKQLKFNLDGSFQILSNGRMLGNTCFSIATPHGQWQTNRGGKKKPGEYDGKQIEVRDIKIDGNKIIFSGLVPWQKKGEKVLSVPWTLTVSNIGKGRFSFRYSYEPPKGQKYGGRGIFLALSNIRQVDMGQYGIWIPVDSKRSGQPAYAMLGTDILPPDGEIAEWNKRLQECFLRNRQSGRISAPRESLLYLHYCQDGTLHFNTTRVIGKNPLDGKELSEAEIMSRKQIREIFTCLKEEIPEFRNAWLVSMAPSIGVRESRHIHGLAKLTLDAFTARMRFPDAVARCNYPVDKHSGKGSGTQCFFMEKNSFYEIPYGCIVAADIDNLTLGGRLISVDSHIHASCRIMPCACSLGQAAGAAAAMAVRQGVRPADLDGVQVRKKLQSMGAFL